MTAKRRPKKKQKSNAKPKKTKTKPASETAIQALARLAARLAAASSDVKLVFKRPSSTKAIEQVEKSIGGKLPPSYVKLITTRGAFKLRESGSDSNAVARAEDLLGMGPHEDLPESVRAEMESCLPFQDILDDAVENYYVFDLKDRRADGELAVRAYFHDDRLQERRGRGRSFDEHISAWVDEMIEDLT